MLKCGAQEGSYIRDVSYLLGAYHLRAIRSGNKEMVRYYEAARWAQVGIHWTIR